METSRKLRCDTCGKKTGHLRRDVVDVEYNALIKPPLWNCQACYEKKRQGRLTSQKNS